MSGLRYSFIEAALLVTFIAERMLHATEASFIVWLAWVAALVWVLSACTDDAEVHAKEMTISGDVLPTDHLTSGLLLLAITLVVSPYGLLLAGAFLLSALQSLRYTVLTFNWIQECSSHGDG